MKFRTTKKAVMSHNAAIIKVSYCGLQTLLNYESPDAYTTRREGWGADIYDMSHIRNGVVIVTGYAPFGNYNASYDLCERFEERARNVLEKYRRSYDYKGLKSELEKLQAEFIDEVLK